MRKKSILLFFILFFIYFSANSQIKILFDNTKSEEAGNADWIIDNTEPIPNPAQSGITGTTTETYWIGAISAWGVEMVKRGDTVETLTSSNGITYNSGTNTQDLSNYDVFVVCEPNNRFTTTEKLAMIDFVQNGGGLFIISDHNNSDRDNDGWDSPNIWNDFFTDYSNPFGISFDLVDITDAPTTNVLNDATDPILHGIAGDVTSMEFHGSATMTLDSTANPTIKGIVYKTGATLGGNTNVMLAYATYGSGRIVALVDSSPADDGTGQSGNTLYDGWDQYNNSGTNGIAITNATIWLASVPSGPTLSTSTTSLSGFSYVLGAGPSTQQSFDVSGSSLDGSDVIISAPASGNYEISLSSGSGYTTGSLTLTAYDGTTTPIYVRLVAGLAQGTYNSENITISGGGATDKYVSLSGYVSSSSYCANYLIISEYYEGGSNDKYLELYNGTGSAIDASNYQILIYANGSTTSNSPINLNTYSIAAGATFIIAHSSANSTILANANQTSGSLTFNGDDAVVLQTTSGTVIDVIGKIGEDPGSQWGSGLTSTADNMLIRKASITTGDNYGSDAFDPTVEWDGYANGDYSYMGNHTMDCSSAQLSTDVLSLTGFSYIVNYGPSTIQTFILSGIDLDGTDVLVSAPASGNYEISTTPGSGYTTGDLTLTAYNGSNQTIYVRLKAGLSVGTYNGQTIVISGGGASDISVSLDGEVLQSVLSVTPTSLSGFSYLFGAGPSTSQSFTLSGTNLDSNLVVVTAPTDYEVSTDNSNFYSSVDVSYTKPTLDPTTIYVRLKSGLALGTYNNEIVTCSDKGQATDVTVTLNGEVVEPTLSTSPTSLSGFTYSEGAGPSASQNFDLSGSNLDGSDVTISAPASGNYEISLSSGSGYTTGSLTLTAYDGTTTTIYVRLIGGLPQGTYNSENITISGGGATSKTVTLSGDVTAPSTACATDLIISEYVEGGSNNKFIELYNGTGATIDLSNYDLVQYNGGGGSITYTLGLSGSIAAGATFVIENSSESLGVSADLSTSNSVMTFNGNDAVALRNNGTVIDIVGDPNSSSDFGKDVTLVRKSSVTSGVTTYNSSEWDTYSQDDVSHLGTHSMDCATTCEVPTVNATTLVFSNITTSSIQLYWTNGDGSNRIVIARQDAPVNQLPIDSTTYTANSAFGSGDDLGSGNFVVYNSSSNTVTVSNLTPGTTYYFKIIEYNCSAGSEHYLTTGTILSGNETTLPNQVTNFKLECSTNNTAEFSWSLPEGNFDGILITALENGIPIDPDCIGSNLSNPQTDYTLAHEYCGNLVTDGVYMYNSVGNTLSISGLTPGQDYTLIAYTYKNSSWSVGSSVTFTAKISDVTGLAATCGNEESTIDWINPNANCYDEVIIVACENTNVTANPSGDGSTYTASGIFGAGTDIGTNEFIVYKGTGENVTVTGLTNGNNYYFKAFVRKGTDWSAGTEVNCSPSNATIFDYNDLAIIGINTHLVEYKISVDYDEIQFVCFKPVTTETSIDFTDNGYEHTTAGKWGTTEGTIRFTRTGSDLPAGQIIVIRGKNVNATPTIGTDFNVYLCNGTSMTNDNANWTVSSLNGNGNFNLNEDDQIWMMQGGNWVVNGTNDAVYTGKVQYGWTATGWKLVPGYASTKGSTVFPGNSCSSTDVTGVNNHDKVKYTGPTDPTSQLGWISRFNDPSNWSGYTDSTTYVNGGSLSCNITITSDAFTAQWTGSASTDWEDCANWLNLRVPDATTDVLFISDTCSNDIVIQPGQKVECNNLTIRGNSFVHSVKLESDSSEHITIHGDLTISNLDSLIDLDDNDNLTLDGQITIYGDWINNQGVNAFIEGNSTVNFKGSTQQNIYSVAKEDFFNLTIKNSSPLGVVNNSPIIKTKGILKIENSILDLNGNNLLIYNTFSQITGYFKGNIASTLKIDSIGTIANLNFISPQELDSLVMNRNETANIVTNLEMNEMLINSGILTLAPAKFYTVNTEIKNNVGTTGLVIKSDASGTASLIHYTENVPATCQRYVNGSAWSYVFSPLSAVPKTILTAGNNPNFYWYNESTQDYWQDYNIYDTMGWTAETNTNIQTDRGYILYPPYDLVYDLKGGNLYYNGTTQNKVFTLSYTDVGSGPVNQNGVTSDWDDFEGWNLIGNPFTSAIDWDQVSLNNVENVIYFWDGNIQNYKYYGPGSSYDQGITVNGGSQYVPANQAFFIKTLANNGTVTIPNTARVHNSQQFWKNAPKKPSNYVKLRIPYGKYYDETAIAISKYSTEYHDDFDAFKFLSYNTDIPQIYSLDDTNSIYAINYLPFDKNLTVPLGFIANNSGEYSFTVPDLTFDSCHVYLIDKQQNQKVKLDTNTVYSFYFSGGKTEQRFELLFTKNRAPYSILPLNDIYKNAKEEFSFRINKNAFTDPDIGDKITLSATLQNGDTLPDWLIFKEGLFLGYYDHAIELKIKVKATDELGLSVYQTFTLNIVDNSTEISKLDNRVSIYPNPADKLINIYIQNIIPNTKIIIYDASGKIVKTILTNKQLNSIDIGNLNQGIYLIKINNNAINEIEKLIIE